MIQPQLYCIEAKYSQDEEPYSLHTVSVDMDEPTARLVASKQLDLDEQELEILAYYEVTVDGFNIILVEE